MGQKALAAVVFDSGIWVSALQYGGVPMHALELALIDDNFLICSEIEVEVVRIMGAKFRRSPESVLERMAAFTENATRGVVTGNISGICRDPKDDFILECAITGNADVIVTGDKDLLSLGTHGSIRILTPRQYLDRAEA
ncbi:MAG TPA: putative toxin-antitoxin system toxin component, PIN family [Acidobacteriaceae bacterium]